MEPRERRESDTRVSSVYIILTLRNDGEHTARDVRVRLRIPGANVDRMTGAQTIPRDRGDEFRFLLHPSSFIL